MQSGDVQATAQVSEQILMQQSADLGLKVALLRFSRCPSELRDAFFSLLPIIGQPLKLVGGTGPHETRGRLQNM